MATIDYDAMVNVQLRSRPDAQGQIRTERTWSKTLARAVRFIMAMPIEERRRVSIWMDASPGKTWLEIEDIEEVFCRPDFPPR